MREITQHKTTEKCVGLATCVCTACTLSYQLLLWLSILVSYVARAVLLLPLCVIHIYREHAFEQSLACSFFCVKGPVTDLVDAPRLNGLHKSMQQHVMLSSLPLYAVVCFKTENRRRGTDRLGRYRPRVRWQFFLHATSGSLYCCCFVSDGQHAH